MPEGWSVKRCASCAVNREVGTTTISVLLLTNNLNKIDDVDVDNDEWCRLDHRQPAALDEECDQLYRRQFCYCRSSSALNTYHSPPNLVSYDEK